MVFTRPQLSDDTVASVVAGAWGLEVSSVEYLAVGFGSHHWEVFAGDCGRWFATIDDLHEKRHEATEPLEEARRRLNAALGTARRLRDLGLGFVVAPMPMQDGGVVAPVDQRFVAALYPWIDGRSYSHGTYYNDADRDEVLRPLSRLHSVDLSDVPEAHPEDFMVPNRAGLMGAIVDRHRPWHTGPYGERVRLLLIERADEIRWLLDRYDRLAVAAAEKPDRFVVSHGEPHAANTLASPEGRMIIDWDTARIAPPERDLWMVLDASDPATPASYAPTRQFEVSQDLLDMYRMLWDLVEIAGYIAFFRTPHSDSADAAESWGNLSTYIDISGRWATT